MQKEFIFTQAKRNKMKTITRTELIDCIADSSVSNIQTTEDVKSELKEGLQEWLYTLDNFFLCELMYKKKGQLMHPKSSQIIEFLN